MYLPNFFLPRRRNHVLATVYMARSDVAYTVRTGERPPALPACLPVSACSAATLAPPPAPAPRVCHPHGSHCRRTGRPSSSPAPALPPTTLPAAALHVWKTVVTNTPKTLGELLPALMAIIIESLADPGGWLAGWLAMWVLAMWVLAMMSGGGCWPCGCWSRCRVVGAGWPCECWRFWPPLLPPLPNPPPPPPPLFVTMHAPSLLPAAGEDRRDMAGRCLGELVRKMGDRILAQIIPILRQGMASPEATTRQVSTAHQSAAQHARRTVATVLMRCQAGRRGAPEDHPPGFSTLGCPAVSPPSTAR